MQFSSGTQISIFDPAKYIARLTDRTQAVRIHDGYQWQLQTERKRSNTIRSIEDHLLAKLLKLGFEATVANGGGRITPITDPLKNPYLYKLWIKEIRKAAKHGFWNGFAAIVIRTIHNPEEVEKADVEIDDQELDEAAEDGPGYLQNHPVANPEDTTRRFFEEEHRRLESQRPEDPGDMNSEKTLSCKVPRTMDPMTEYWVGRRTEIDGSYTYEAYFRDNSNEETPIPDSFVFVFKEPDSFGVPESIFLNCFSELQLLRCMLERYELRDYNATKRIFIYQSRNKESGGIIPVDTHISVAETGIETPAEKMQTSSTWKGERPVLDRSLEKRKLILKETNEYMEKTICESIARTVTPGTKLVEPRLHPQLLRLTHLPEIDQFNPSFVLPDQVELSPNVPQVIQPGNWDIVIKMLQTSIANSTGVLPQVLHGDRAVVGADVEANREENNTRMRLVQEQLEEMIAQIYVRIFAPHHKATIGYTVASFKHQKRMQLLQDADLREQLRHQLQQEYDLLTEEYEVTLEESAKAEIMAERTEILNKLRKIPDLDQMARSFPWDTDGEVQYPGGPSDEWLQITLQAQMKIRIHVFENPSLTFNELLALRNASVIDELHFRQLALRILGLPLDYISKDPLISPQQQQQQQIKQQQQQAKAQQSEKKKEDKAKKTSSNHEDGEKDKSKQAPKRQKTD